MGTQAGTRVFEGARDGQRANGALNMGWVGGMLLLLLVRGPWCAKDVWVGGWTRRTPLVVDVEAAGETTEAGEDGGREKKGENGEVDVAVGTSRRD